ncbi:hypothetical protein Cal6303_1460 [Calothrix sp. PCC 6303]|nr:hypothetical protein Cal6303_1460 [Calothrix sp. PCC 6303]
MMGRVIILLVLFLFLNGCSNNIYTPNNNLAKKAVAIQVQQTQAKLTQQLDLDIKGFEIKHLAIRQLQSKSVQNLPAYHVQGVYDLVLKLPKRQLTTEKKPFDIYMQLQKEGKTWRLLQPEKGDGETVWRSYLVN